MSALAAIFIVLLVAHVVVVALGITGIGRELSSRSVMRKRSRAQRDLRDVLIHMRRK